MKTNASCRAALCLGLALLQAACSGDVVSQASPAGAAPDADGDLDGDDQGTSPGGMGGAGAPSTGKPGYAPSPTLRRLTLSQYENSVRDLLGVQADVSKLTPLTPLNGLRAIAASTLALPERDVETFHNLADTLTAQVFSEPTARQKLVGCDAKQAACREQFLLTLGRRAFRRPLSSDERTRYVALLEKAATSTGDGWLGLQVVTGALLQSPHMLYRVELGEVDPKDKAQRRLTDLELASRLSYFLWNSTPDAELLDAAETGKLATSDGIAVQAKRLLASPRASEAIDELFSDYLQLGGLDALTKLPETYPSATPTLAAALRTETLMTLRELVFKRALDFREVFTTPKTFVNGELAKLYGVRTSSADKFTEIDLPGDGPRAGLLLQGSFLALHAHPTRSSPTLRGKFIRESLLCQSIPPPPNNVETTLPDTAGAKTAREKLAAHRENAACAGCHAMMDPMGLALEHFDGIGAYRQSENGLNIDASGELDGTAFEDARGLATALAEHPDLASCFVKTVLRYARGAIERSEEENGSIAKLDARFAALGHKLPELLLTIATDSSFRYVGAL
jgi:hypothetical protein